MTLAKYIKFYRENHGLSQRQFAALSGLSNGYISMLEAGENPKTGKPLSPTLQVLGQIASATGVTIDELFDKVDDMGVLVDLAGPVFESIKQKHLLSLAESGNITPLPRMDAIPLLGTIACGEPILAEENVEAILAKPEDIAADFCLRCKGDSMINARIFDGDIVYIRQQPQVEDGEIAAVLIGEEATLKRVRLFPDHVSLEPENPQYRPLVYWGADMEAVRILGKAVAFTSAVR